MFNQGRQAEDAEQNQPFLSRKVRYQLVWRWHFFAGLYVLPFMAMLAITGLLMVLYKPVIEPIFHGEKITVQEQGHYISWEKQKQAVAKQYKGKVVQLSLPKTVNESSRFLVKRSEFPDLQVFVNPYTGDVLGDYVKGDTAYSLANDIHGTLLMGKVGDALIELAMGFSLVLLFTGLYMWWPRLNVSVTNFLKPVFSTTGRRYWKELHGTTGVWLSIILIFFIITGLSWTGIWGEKLVQPWNSFPKGVFDDVPLSSKTHKEVNSGTLEEVPWNLEQLVLPASGSMAGKSGIDASLPINLDTVIAYARDNGMTYFRVNLPQDETDVYTIMAATMGGDITNAKDDRTMHIDQYTGNKLGDITYDQYNVMAKSMAIGVGLHMGLWGTWNIAVNVAMCLLTLFLCFGGCILWRKRGSSEGSSRLNAPSATTEYSMITWRAASLMWLAVSIFVPLMVPVIFVILMVDKFLLNKAPRAAIASD